MFRRPRSDKYLDPKTKKINNHKNTVHSADPKGRTTAKTDFPKFHYFDRNHWKVDGPVVAAAAVLVFRRHSSACSVDPLVSHRKIASVPNEGRAHRRICGHWMLRNYYARNLWILHPHSYTDFFWLQKDNAGLERIPEIQLLIRLIARVRFVFDVLLSISKILNLAVMIYTHVYHNLLDTLICNYIVLFFLFL